MNDGQSNANNVMLGFFVLAAVVGLLGFHMSKNDDKSACEDVAKELEDTKTKLLKLQAEYDGYQKGRR